MNSWSYDTDMHRFAGAVGFVVCALTLVRPLAYGQRGFITQFAAWEDPSIAMVTGKVVKVTLPPQSLSEGPNFDRNARYEFLVSEWLKPRDSGFPQRITISETWGATDTAVFRPGVEVLLFLRGDHSLREIHLDSLKGQQTMRGLRLFLSVMYNANVAQRRKACLEAWGDRLSDPEKRAVLDAMWVTRTPEYSDALLKISLGNDSPDVRAWALGILGSIEQRLSVEELVPLLLTESDCEVKRQLLFVFGMYRVQQAVTAIDEFLAGNHAGQCTSWRAEAIRAKAQDARDKITGKDLSLGWR